MLPGQRHRLDGPLGPCLPPIRFPHAHPHPHHLGVQQPHHHCAEQVDCLSKLHKLSLANVLDLAIGLFSVHFVVGACLSAFQLRFSDFPANFSTPSPGLIALLKARLHGHIPERQGLISTAIILVKKPLGFWM